MVTFHPQPMHLQQLRACPSVRHTTMRQVASYDRQESHLSNARQVGQPKLWRRKSGASPLGSVDLDVVVSRSPERQRNALVYPSAATIVVPINPAEISVLPYSGAVAGSARSLIFLLGRQVCGA